MKEGPLISIMLLLFLAMSASAQSEIPLWTGAAPNALGKLPEDIPTIAPFISKKENSSRAAIVVFPGGGYSHLSSVKEGTAVAEWLNRLGISAFVVKYRLGMRYHAPNQLLDAARAVRMVRARASEWNIDPSRIGVLGFSAGGHLASTISTRFDSGNPHATDRIDQVSSRPDIQILIYPVITMGRYTHAGSKKNLLGESPTDDLIRQYSNELQTTKETPPAFIVHTSNDASVPVENSLSFAAALRAAGVPFEMAIYESGPHGFGLAPNDKTLATWTERCADWLTRHRFTTKEGK
jgi:acetyl esterase/lipase